MPFTDTNDQTPPIAGDATSDSQTQPTPATNAPDATAQPTQQDQQGQSAQPQSGMVSNAQVPSQGQQIASTIDSTPPTHPAVQRASLINSIGEALAGGPRYQTAINPTTGDVTRTKVPLSGKEIGMAIALEALSGSLAGYGVKNGPGNLGRAAAAGFDNAAQQRQQADQVQEQQAQQDAKAKSDAIVRAASIADTNARTMLSTAEAEGRGADTLAKIAATNKPLIDSYEDAGKLLDRNVDQQSLLAGMQSGKYSSTAMLGPIDGYKLSGDGKVEALHAVISDPSAKVPLTQAQWDEYAANHVQGFKPGVKIVDSSMVNGVIIARANEQKTAFQLAQLRHDEVADALRQSDDPNVKVLANQIPTVNSVLDDPKKGAGLSNALNRFQSYESHADINHGQRDIYESLQAMAQPSMQDPNNPKATIPNKNAPFANTVAAAFSPDGSAQNGWKILKMYHDEVVPEQITNEGQAADMVASSEPGSRAYNYAQRWIASNTAQKAAVARAGAEARESVKPPSPASLTTPDALGFTPTVTDSKEANKRFGTFKKNLDDLSRSEQSYTQFQQAIANVNAGNWTGADSVVSLFNAIGISATALAGKGFRINQNTIKEHETARGWEGALQAKLQGATTGAVITPQQLRDYAGIASQSRANQIISTANEMHNAGIPADAALPNGNGAKITPDTARIFLTLSGGDKDKARAAASQKGWAY